jgi:uncharacterized protein YecE (DUF72 family)
MMSPDAFIRGDAEATRNSPGAPAPSDSVRIGPAGWSYPDWAGLVYPKPKPRGFNEIEFLAQYFDTIEINTSFYQPLRAEHCRQWIAKVSGNSRFLFTAKLWKRFTHQDSPSLEEEREVRAGFEVLRDAGKLGAVLLQFPFSFHRDPENTAYLDSLLKRFADFPLAVEVRHASWNEVGFYAMLYARGVGFCNIDQPLIGRSLRPTEHATASIGYVRLHGRRYDTWFSDDPELPRSERYNYLYNEEELEPWAKRIDAVASRTKNTFVLTNNHYLGKSAVNALQLISLLRGVKVNVPEPLRQHYPQLELIASEPSREPTLFPLSVPDSRK